MGNFVSKENLQLYTQGVKEAIKKVSIEKIGDYKKVWVADAYTNLEYSDPSASYATVSSWVTGETYFPDAPFEGMLALIDEVVTESATPMFYPAHVFSRLYEYKDGEWVDITEDGVTEFVFAWNENEGTNKLLKLVDASEEAFITDSTHNLFFVEFYPADENERKQAAALMGNVITQRNEFRNISPETDSYYSYIIENDLTKVFEEGKLYFMNNYYYYFDPTSLTLKKIYEDPNREAVAQTGDAVIYDWNGDKFYTCPLEFANIKLNELSDAGGDPILLGIVADPEKKTFVLPYKMKFVYRSNNIVQDGLNAYLPSNDADGAANMEVLMSEEVADKAAIFYGSSAGLGWYIPISDEFSIVESYLADYGIELYVPAATEIADIADTLFHDTVTVNGNAFYGYAQACGNLMGEDPSDIFGGGGQEVFYSQASTFYDYNYTEGMQHLFYNLKGVVTSTGGFGATNTVLMGVYR